MTVEEMLRRAREQAAAKYAAGPKAAPGVATQNALPIAQMQARISAFAKAFDMAKAISQQPKVPEQTQDWRQAMKDPNNPLAYVGDWRGMPKKAEELNEFQRSFQAGVGDVYSSIGGALKWIGAEGAGEKLMEKAAPLQAMAPTDVPEWQFTWKNYFNPRYWTTEIARALPFTLALIPIGILGAYTAAATGLTGAAASAVTALGAKAAGMGAFGKAVVGALAKAAGVLAGGIGAGALQGPAEAAMEAGGTYNEAIAMGMSDEEADAAADSTFRKNLALLGLSNTIEWGMGKIAIPGAGKLASTTAGKLLSPIARAGLAGVTEAAEEAYQEWAQASSLGKDFSLGSPEAQRAMMAGFAMGGGQSMTGVAQSMATLVRNKVVEKVTPEQGQRLKASVEEKLAQGIPGPAAVVMAMDELASTPEGKAAVEAAVEEIVKEQVPAAQAEQPATTETAKPKRGRKAKPSAAQPVTTEVATAGPINTEPIQPTEAVQTKVPTVGPRAEFKPGQVVYHPTTGQALTVTDATDPAMLTVQNAQGTALKIGKGAVKLEAPQAQQASDTVKAEQPESEIPANAVAPKIPGPGSVSHLALGKKDAFGVDVYFKNNAYRRMYEFGKDIADDATEYDTEATVARIREELDLPADVDVWQTALGYYKRIASEAAKAGGQGKTAGKAAQFWAGPLLRSDLKTAQETETKPPLTDQEGAVLETFKEVLPQAKEVSEELIQQEIAYLEATMKKGVIPGGPIRNDAGEIVGHYPTISQNERWYQEWMKTHKRPPTKAQLRELAIRRLERGGPVNAHEMGPNQEFLEAQQIIETVEALEERTAAEPVTLEAAARAKTEAEMPEALEAAREREAQAKERVEHPAPAEDATKTSVMPEAAPTSDTGWIPKGLTRKVAEQQEKSLARKQLQGIADGKELWEIGDSEASAAKAEVVANLAEELSQKVDTDDLGWFAEEMRLPRKDDPEAQAREVVNYLVSSWAKSAEEDGGLAAAVIHLATNREFGLNSSMEHLDPEVLNRAEKLVDEYDGLLRAFTRAQYEQTQKWFAKQGIKEVTLYRGMSFDELPQGLPEEVGIAKFHLQPASSFSYSWETAQDFARARWGDVAMREFPVVMAARVPVSRIMATSRTGMGSLREAEMVVLGNDIEAAFASANLSGGMWSELEPLLKVTPSEPANVEAPPEPQAPETTGTEAAEQAVMKRAPKKGDTITDGVVTGQVVGEGTVGKVDAWKIAIGPGKFDFIGKDDPDLKVIVSKSVKSLTEAEKPETPAKPKAPSTADKMLAKKFRSLADGMQKQIDAKRHPAVANLNPTARRNRMIENSWADADRLESIQTVMRAMADRLEDGTLPELLKGLKSRAHVEAVLTGYYREPAVRANYVEDLIEATKKKTNTADDRAIAGRVARRAGPNRVLVPVSPMELDAIERLLAKDSSFGTATWLKDDIAAFKRLTSAGIQSEAQFKEAKELLASMTKKETAEEAKQREIKKAEMALTGLDIPGYFPTPKAVVDRILEEADIKPGMKVLEPSAGKGNIADAVKAAVPDADLSVNEINPRLLDILKAKGYNPTQEDFLQMKDGQYDRIVMNPPFEQMQDADHVRHAYDLLKPGGRLVSIMSPSAFFRSDKKATSFREWFEEVGGVKEDLPQGSFKSSERPTGVATVMVTIGKPGEAVPAASKAEAEPWQLTQAEYIEKYLAESEVYQNAVKNSDEQNREIERKVQTNAAIRKHTGAVQTALIEGKPVPQSVVDDLAKNVGPGVIPPARYAEYGLEEAKPSAREQFVAKRQAAKRRGNAPTVYENKARGEVELRFKAKPDEGVLSQLREAGFEWSKQRNLWWAKASDEMLAKAKAIRDGEAITEAVPADTTEAAGEVAASAATDLAQIEETLEKELDSTVGRSTDLGIVPQAVAQAIPPSKAEVDGYWIPDEDVRERWKQSNGVTRLGAWEKLLAAWDDLSRKATREFEHLPRTAENAEIRYQLLELRKQPDVRNHITLTTLRGLIDKVRHDPRTWTLFEGGVVFNDLQHEYDAGRDLPYGMTREQFVKIKENLDAEIAQHPEVKDALARRNKVWKSLVKAYVDAMEAIGFHVEQRFLNEKGEYREDYFHHQVLEHANDALARFIPGSTGKKLKTPTNRGWLKKREGYTGNINRNYVEAEFEVMAQMMFDIQKAKMIALVQSPKYNVMDKCRAEAKQANEQAIERMIMEEKAGYARKHPRAEKMKSDIETALNRMRGRIAWGFQQLSEMADAGDLWDGDRHEFADVVNSLKAQPDFDVDPDVRNRTFEYLAALKAAEVDGSMQAATILKNVSERREFIRETLGDDYKTWEDMIPEGYVAWQPREGNVFYMANSIPEKIAEQLVEGVLKELGIDASDVRQIMAVGGKRPSYVIREEIALTLDNLTRPRPSGEASGLVRKVVRAWKAEKIIGPGRIVKSNMRNLSGDADAVFVGNPSAFKKVPGVVEDLYRVYFKDAPITGEMKHWFERGGMESTFNVQDIGDVSQLRVFRSLVEQKGGLKALPEKVWRKYWDTANLSFGFRESILRYACYLDYLEQMQASKDGKPKNFGASIPEEIMALPDIRDRAYVLSNQLLGAYDQVSVLGQALADSIAFFWRYREVNFRRYIQLYKNAMRDGRTGEVAGKVAVNFVKRSPMLFLRATKFAMKAGFFWAMLSAFNHGFFPDEEEELPEDVRNKPHLVLGRNPDGSVRYFSNLGAVGDFLEWFGMDAPQRLVGDWLSGRKTLGEAMVEIGKAPVNALWQQLTWIKTVAELVTGRKTYPSLFETGKVRDKWQYLFDQFGLGGVYKEVAGLPQRPWQQRMQELLVYTDDAGEGSYYDVLDEKREFQKKIGKFSEFGGQTNPRSNALYNLKLAIRYQDREAMEKYLAEYIALGGTAQGLETSLRNMHPLFGLNKEEQRVFIQDWLDDEGRARLGRALEFYERVLLGKRETEEKKDEE